MRLTVLGSSASYAGPGQACAGYLVSTESTHILLDCGNGALANLGRVMDPLELDALFVTHGHPDHFLDVYSLQALLRYAPDGPAPAMPLYLPSGVRGQLDGILSERGRAEMADAFLANALSPGVDVAIGDLVVTPVGVSHSDGALGLSVSDGWRRIFYTADAALTDELAVSARGCDLLLAEATLPERYRGAVAHMTAAEAGTLAARADAGRLVLTHIWPTTDRRAILDEARAVFSGEVTVAEELAVYVV